MAFINDIPKRVQEFASDNASTLLTAGAVVGTVATGLLAGRAGYKYAKLIEEAELERRGSVSDDEWGDVERENVRLSKLEKVQVAGVHVIPPVVTGGLTIGAIVFANRMNAQKAAALAAAYGLSQKQLEDYKTKVAEKLTGPKNQQIKDEVAQQQIDDNPVSKQVIIVAGGDVLCYDTTSGRYFRSSMERIKRAENELNQELFDTQMASLSEYYVKLGLPATGMSDLLGWTAFEDGIIELEVTTGESENREPCFIITPSRTPEPNFHKMHGT